MPAAIGAAVIAELGLTAVLSSATAASVVGYAVITPVTNQVQYVLDQSE